MAQARRTPEDWARMRSVLLGMLEAAARNRATVTYRDVAVHVFGGTVPARSRLIMDLLSEVDEQVFVEHGIIIASLVVRADSGIPGEGYFHFIASRFGRDVSDPRAAWCEEAEKVWATFTDGASRGEASE